MKKLLLAEDDRNLADALTLILKSQKYEVVHVRDGKQALDILDKNEFDLILLDIMMPLVDGISVCKQIRLQGNVTPVLFLTARDQTKHKIEGLVAGGDDYITKPFDTQELLARIHGIFRRNSWLSAERSPSAKYNFGGCTINFKTFEAVGPNGIHKLSSKECMVVKYLVEHSGEVVSRDDLLDAIWGYHNYPTNRTVDNFILKLRKIFEKTPDKPVLFETVRGAGYRFVPPQKN